MKLAEFQAAFFWVKWEERLYHEIKITYDMLSTFVRCNLLYRHIAFG